MFDKVKFVMVMVNFVIVVKVKRFSDWVDFLVEVLDEIDVELLESEDF